MDEDDIVFVVTDEVSTLVVDNTGSTLVVSVTEQTVVAVSEGPPGRDGRSGGGIPVETFPINNASSLTVSHSFPYAPDVRVVDTNGHNVETDYVYIGSQVSLTFPSPFTGTLYLN